MRINRLFFLSLIFGVAACANIVPPAGGPRDLIPPQLVKTHSTPNYQINFKKQRIELSFDEWVKLDSVFQQVFVSPPVNERPEVTLHKKTVWIEFDKNEILRPNTTYTVNLGNSVKDITEGNAARNLRFVFSTGPILDSLTVAAVVTDAVKGEPVQDALIMLYDNLNDSVVRKVKPLYFAQTDKNGYARVENIKAGKYKVFALKDADQNYLYNQETELIGFPDHLITLPDTAITPAPIQMFQSRRSLRLLTKETSLYGSVHLTFTRDPENVPIHFDDVGQTVVTERGPDSTVVRYDSPKETPWNLYIEEDSSHIDTLRIRARKGDFLKNRKLETPGGKFASVSQPAFKDFRLTFNSPLLTKIDTSKIHFLDSLNKPVPYSIFVDSSHRREMVFKAGWLEEMRYRLTALPGAFTDLYGIKSDTLDRRIVVASSKDFGDFLLQISRLDSAKQYIIQILADGTRVEKQYIKSGIHYFEQSTGPLSPGVYALKIIEDDNRNGIWDTGDYEAHRQPERIWLLKSSDKLTLRASWSNELPYSLEK